VAAVSRLKALSVRQPWAWAILHGGKTVENRTWTTRHRGPLVIHASSWRGEQGRDYTRLLPGLPPWDQLVYGALVGMVDVIDCVPLAQMRGDPFAVGPWCWLLANPRPIRPVLFKGKASLFRVPADLVVAIDSATSPSAASK
jgi:hypothetical protein